MVQFIQGRPSFGEQMGASVGQGIQEAIKMFSEAMKEKQKQQQINEILGIGRSPSEDFSKSVMNESSYQEDPFTKALALEKMGEHGLARIETEKGKQKSKESFAREQAGETKMQELQDQLATTEETGLRFERLGKLSSPEFEGKFPPSLMTALFTKNGELNPIAQSQLSPEAQEFTKLVIDEIQGAQKTYGGKVSNFEAAQYLKKLPSLINTPEGRRRVLRDLKIMNKISENHSKGVLDIVERYGGPGKISISKANTLYRKEHAKDEAAMKKAFVNPEEFPFTELDDFNASIYPGVTIEDPETKQIFTSNGQTWEPS